MTGPIAPIVDIGGWADGDAATRARIAADLDAAARATGFLQLVGHGIPDELRAAALDAMDRFFRRPDEAKARCVPADPALYRGWSGRKSESFAYSIGDASPADLVEAFLMGADDVGGTTPAHAPNVWPDDVDGFRDAIWGWYVAARDVARTLAEIAASAIGMDPAVLAEFSVQRDECQLDRRLLKKIDYFLSFKAIELQGNNNSADLAKGLHDGIAGPQ